MKQLWSSSTTMRNPERLYGFLLTASEIDGEEWTRDKQIEYQCRLIKNRYYIPNNKNKNGENVLDDKLQEKFDDLNYSLSLEKARKIFELNNYNDPAMRGRTSLDPLEKMGVISLINNKISITDTGRRFLESKIDIGNVMLSYLLKFQYPNPLMKGFRGYNTKPFINTLRLITKVNEKCLKKGEKSKGISKDEFGIFVLSLTDYREVENTADKLLIFRNNVQEIKDSSRKKEYIKNYTVNYLKDFNNPLKNVREYTDNIIRCLRLTKYVYIHSGYYVDVEPRRVIEINSILENDDGSARQFNKISYTKFMGNYDSYILPFETIDKLKEIKNNIIKEITSIKKSFTIANDNNENLQYDDSNDITELKHQIDKLRNYKLNLQNECIKIDYHSKEQIDKVQNSLADIHNLALKPSIALEKWVNVAMNIINDADFIKPNCPFGDDHEPTFTAPAKVPDIECYYDLFNAIVEVTMLTGRDQWFNEGQPVMRHLREFEKINNKKKAYCIFVAPRIHQDTINTFWNAVKYEYEGERQRIIPITISNLISLLETIKTSISNGKQLFHVEMMNLYDRCLDVTKVKNSIEWRGFIQIQIDEFNKKHSYSVS